MIGLIFNVALMYGFTFYMGMGVKGIWLAKLISGISNNAYNLVLILNQNWQDIADKSVNRIKRNKK